MTIEGGLTRLKCKRRFVLRHVTRDGFSACFLPRTLLCLSAKTS